MNNETHPFDGEQCTVMALTTQTCTICGFRWTKTIIATRKRRGSSIVPHAVAPVRPDLATDYVFRIHDEPLDEAIEMLLEYLWSDSGPTTRELVVPSDENDSHSLEPEQQ